MLAASFGLPAARLLARTSSKDAIVNGYSPKSIMAPFIFTEVKLFKCFHSMGIKTSHSLPLP